MNHIRKVEIENIRGIKHMVIDLTELTVLRGSNGSGKSSVVEAIRLVFAGGYDPLAVSTWAEAGKVVLTGDDGTTITRSINKTKRTSTLDIRSEAGEKVAAPQGYIDNLTQIFSYDPLKLLRCTPTERFKYLKETLTVEVGIDEFLELARHYSVDDSVIYESWDAKAAGLDRIAKLRKAVYERRTKINSKARDLDGSIKTMKASVPSLNADGVDWRAAEAAASLELAEAKRAWGMAVQQAGDEAAAAKDAIDGWEREEIARIKAEAAARREVIQQALAATLDEVNGQHQPTVAALIARHAEARQQLSDYDKAIGAREAIAKLEVELKDSRTLGDKYTFIIEGIDKIEKQKLEASPVDGVLLRDGEVFIDGVAFDGVNTQRRYRAAIEIGAVNAGPLKFMLCDEMEHWDEGNFKAFAEAAKEAGFQVVCAVVDNCPLTVQAA